MEQVVKTLVDYFKVEIPTLQSSYNWKIPQIPDFALSGEADYAANVELKKYFNRRWCSSNFEEKLVVAEDVVSKWGGVRGNKLETLRVYVERIEKAQGGNVVAPLSGVASYSKIFAIADIEKYVIYDARVAACLNAIQWNSGMTTGLAFNYVSGRNNTIGHAGKRIGFVYEDSFTVSSLQQQGWQGIDKNITYRTYLDLLWACLQHLSGSHLYDLEMILFTNAERECVKALQGIRTT